jgi:LasA protease
MRRIRLALSCAALSFVLAACGGGDPIATPEAASGAAPAQAGPDGLDQAVASALRAAKSEQVAASYGSTPDPVVETQRVSDDGEWVFGGAYFPLPSTLEDTSPVTALFIARKVGQGWQVTLEDSDQFHEVAQTAPDKVVSPAERAVFTQHARSARKRMEAMRADATAQAAAQDVGLSMPFERNGAVWGTAGVHGDSGSSRPYNAIDFWGGDGRVRASRDGIAYKFCTNSRWPYIKVVHDNGWTTGYYHTRNQAAIANGQRVREGEFLAMNGVELPCGGRANGDHVHWTLWRGGASGGGEAVHGKLIGGWTWYEGGQPYAGYAERNGSRVYAGYRGLVNYGHDGGTPPGTDPCSGTGCEQFTGSFGTTGQMNIHPSGGWFWHGGGTLQGWLQGPAGTNFDLVLGRYNGNTGQWDKFASSEGETSQESLSFNASAGYYRWRINRLAGAGSYTLWTLR